MPAPEKMRMEISGPLEPGESAAVEGNDFLYLVLPSLPKAD